MDLSTGLGITSEGGLSVSASRAVILASSAVVLASFAVIVVAGYLFWTSASVVSWTRDSGPPELSGYRHIPPPPAHQDPRYAGNTR